MHRPIGRYRRSKYKESQTHDTSLAACMFISSCERKSAVHCFAMGFRVTVSGLVVAAAYRRITDSYVLSADSGRYADALISYTITM